MSEIVKFSVNNWSDNYYPTTEIFDKWMSGEHVFDYFVNPEFAKEHKLVVVVELIDMSINFAICAPEEFCKEYCPEILDTSRKYCNKKLLYSDEDEYGLFGTPFKEYTEENIGVWQTWIDTKNNNKREWDKLEKKIV